MSDKSTTKLTAIEDQVSYAVGLQMGEQLAGQSYDGIHTESVLAGMADVLNKQPRQLSEDELRAAIEDLNQRMMKKQAEESENQEAAGEMFLAENGDRAEVITTASGLQYEILTEGVGEKPSASSTVEVHYHGTLIDGRIFDSSVERDETIEFPVNDVIAGWIEALQLMPIGSKWKLFIPHDLAYGANGAGVMIDPYATLIFEVELIAVK